MIQNRSHTHSIADCRSDGARQCQIERLIVLWVYVVQRRDSDEVLVCPNPRSRVCAAHARSRTIVENCQMFEYYDTSASAGTNIAISRPSQNLP